MNLQEWRQIRDHVIGLLHYEWGLRPSQIARKTIAELYPYGQPLTQRCEANGRMTFPVGKHLQNELHCLYPQLLLIMDYPITQKVFTSRPFGRPLTAATVGRILRQDKPF